MITLYIRLALRHLLKHRLYCMINIIGLAIGFTVYLFGFLLVDYEYNHDHMFAKRDAIYTVGSVFAPTSGRNVREFPNCRLAYGPLFKAQIPQALEVVRALHKVRLVSANHKLSHQGMRYVDSGFTTLFDFNYLHGDSSVLNDPAKLIITKSKANHWFGRSDVVGEQVIIANKYPMLVGAVIADIAFDSHFNSSFMPDFNLDVIASLNALANAESFDMAGEWHSLNPADMTYILLDQKYDMTWLQTQIDEVARVHTPVTQYQQISHLKVRQLKNARAGVWDSLGFPVFESIKLLATLVLLIGAINYANLATVQNFGRIKEIGLRKVFGAKRSQLLMQFIFESLILVSVAMLLALGCLELIIGLYNQTNDKAMQLSYGDIFVWLTLTTVVVAILSGGYPAFAITRFSPIQNLRFFAFEQGKGRYFYHFMVMVQFAIAIFMLSLVLVIYFQNVKVLALAEVYPKSNIVVLNHLNRPQVKPHQAHLRQAFLKLPAVVSVSLSSTVPLAENNRTMTVMADKNRTSLAFAINVVAIDQDFMKTYEIALLAGEALKHNQVDQPVGVIINQLGVEKLGFSRGQEAIGQSFFDSDGSQYTVIGLMASEYFFGVYNKIKPLVFVLDTDSYTTVSIKLNSDNLAKTVSQIEAIWSTSINDYPINLQSLDEVFDFFYNILQSINRVLALFAGVALSLALIGLFALTAFMTEQRSKEISLRKMVGASMTQIVVLLIWQLSKSVIWSLLIAMPLAYMASTIYLDFFPARIEMILPIIILGSAIGVFSAWVIIALHAIHIAGMTPIRSLRHKS